MKKFLYGLLAVLFMMPMGFMLSACSKTYTVKYYVDGHVYQSVEFKTGETVPQVEDPEKVGYDFAGWFLETSTAGDEFFDFNDVIDGNVNLYAQWSKTTYTITYNLDDGTNGENPATYNIETPDITLANASKTGYVFAGWYDNENFQGDQVTKILRGSHGNIELYAKFEIENYSVTYNLNGGNQNANNQTGYNITFALTLYDATKEGHTFGGWYYDSEFNGDAVTTIPAGSTGNKVLYAKWTVNQYSISFSTGEGGSNVPTITQNYGTPIEQPQDPTRPGYDFAGWYLGSAEYSWPETMPVGTSQDGTTTVLEAHWNTHQYSITYNNLEGAYNSNPPTYTILTDTFNLAQATGRTGYTFGGWYDNDQFTGNAVTQIAKGTYGDKVLWAKWTETGYTIAYHNTEGAELSNVTEIYTITIGATLPNATKTGYDFGGWYDNDQCTGNAITSISAGTTGDKEYWAKWTAISYTITYNGLNGATHNNPATYTIEDATIVLNSASKDNYDFTGWYSAEVYDFEHAVTQITHGSYGHKILYANFVPTQYTIYFNSSGGSPVANITQAYGTQVAAPDEPTKDGYTFAGWFYGNNQQTFPMEMPAGGTTLVAHWTANQYTATLQTYDGTFAGSRSYHTGEVVEAPDETEFEREHYTFTGWLVVDGDGYWEDCVGDVLPAGASTEGETETVYGNITLQATYIAHIMQVSSTEDLAEALANTNINYIEFVDDVADAAKFDINRNMTLDLNNHELAFAGNNQYLIGVEANKTVVIKDGAISHTSSVILTPIKSFITNHGTLTLDNIDLQVDNVDSTGADNINAVGNWGAGVLTINDCEISISTKETTANSFKPIGVWNMGTTCTITGSTINVNSATTGSTYGVYCYIDDSEVAPGTRTVNISDTTINATSSVVNTNCAVFAESYVAGEDNRAIINIGENTVINSTRTAESGSGKKTYALRAKGNAVVNVAADVQLTITDPTDCEKVYRGAETTGVIYDEVATAAQLAAAVAETSIANIKLVDDFSAPNTIVTRDLTIDLNNHTVTFAGWGFEASNNATLTMNGPGSVVAEEAALHAQYAGHIVVNGGTYTSTANFVVGTNGTAGRGGNTIVINGGTFNGDMCEEGRQYHYVACGVYVANDDTVTINAGTFNITGGIGVLARSGNTTVGEDVVINVTADATNASGLVGDSAVMAPTGEALVLDLAAGYIGGVPTLTNNTTYNVYTVNP